MSTDRSNGERIRRLKARMQAVHRAQCPDCPDEGSRRTTDESTRLSRMIGQLAYTTTSANGTISTTSCCDPLILRVSIDGMSPGLVRAAAKPRANRKVPEGKVSERKVRPVRKPSDLDVSGAPVHTRAEKTTVASKEAFANLAKSRARDVSGSLLKKRTADVSGGKMKKRARDLSGGLLKKRAMDISGHRMNKWTRDVSGGLKARWARGAVHDVSGARGGLLKKRAHADKDQTIVPNNAVSKKVAAVSTRAVNKPAALGPKATPYVNYPERTLVLPINGNVTVDWGDGTTKSYRSGPIVHQYAAADAQYTVKVTGSASTFGNGYISYAGAPLITEVVQWGSLGLKNLAGAFNGAYNLISVPKVLPPGVTDTSYMFYNASSFDSDISAWDTSAVTSMAFMFTGTESMEQDISAWDVKAVKNVSGMFTNSYMCNNGSWPSFSQAAIGGEYTFSFIGDYNKGCLDNGGDIGIDDIMIMELWVNAGDVLELPFQPTANEDVNVVVFWGDGAVDQYYTSGYIAHTYAISGYVQLGVYSNNYVEGFGKGGLTSGFHLDLAYEGADMILNVAQWGNSLFYSDTSTSFAGAFFGAKKLASVPNDIPSFTRNTSYMFFGAEMFNCDISNWYTGYIQDMSFMFYGAKAFNGDISDWDLSYVGDNQIYPDKGTANGYGHGSFSYMFCGATSFNQMINQSTYFSSNLYSMDHMFFGATSFNQDISGWDLDMSSLQDMSFMFAGATSFNQDLSNWSTLAGLNASGMFLDCPLMCANPAYAPEFCGSIFGNTQCVDASAMTIEVRPDENGNVEIPISGNDEGTSVRVNWGDGNEDVVVYDDNYPSHTYSDNFIGSSALVTITDASGEFSLGSRNSPWGTTIKSIGQWGAIKFTDFEDVFFGTQLVSLPPTLPKDVTNLDSAFTSSDFTYFISELNGWDTSSVTNLYNIFAYSRTFNKDISKWNTSNVTDMRYMFQDAVVFNADLSNWNTRNVVHMGWMFYNAKKFNADIGNWNTGSVNNFDGEFPEFEAGGMSYMFYGASSFNQDISNWDVSTVGTMDHMFGYATSFNKDISKWNLICSEGDDICNVFDTSFMFNGATKFYQNLSNWYLAGLNASGMFLNCPLMSANASYLPFVDTYFNNSTTDPDVMALEFNIEPFGEIRLPLYIPDNGEVTVNWGDGNIETYYYEDNIYHEYSFFGGDIPFNLYVLVTVKTSTLNTNSIYNFQNTIFGFETKSDLSDNYIFSEQLRSVPQWGNLGIRILDYIFGSTRLSALPPNLPSTVITMRGMFFDADLTDLVTDIGTWDTSNIGSIFVDISDGPSDMSELFQDIRFGNYEEFEPVTFAPNLTKWNTQYVQYMDNMFSADNREVNNSNPNICNWNTSLVGDMSRMFNYAVYFNANISNWNTGNVEYMYGMFNGASSFNQPIGNWDTDSVTDMTYMFSNTQFNQEINGWYTGNVVLMYSMFYNSYFNQYIGNWNVASVTDMSYMFNNSIFNQSLGSWNTADLLSTAHMFDHSYFDSSIFTSTDSVVNMSWMFANSVFNDPSISGLKTQAVTNMDSMFAYSIMNQNINYDNLGSGSWNTGNVVFMNRMFSHSNFNSPISGWNTVNVTTMARMFEYSPFNQVINYNNNLAGSWNTINVQAMDFMFQYDISFNQAISEWRTGNLFYMNSMFEGASAFNQYMFTQSDNRWYTVNVRHMARAFCGASSFNQDISNWNLSNILNASEYDLRAKDVFQLSAMCGNTIEWPHFYDVSGLPDDLNDPYYGCGPSFSSPASIPFGNGGVGYGVETNGDGLWVAVGQDIAQNGNNIVYSTNPGSAWSIVTGQPFAGGANGRGYAVARAGSIWVAGGEDVSGDRNNILWTNDPTDTWFASVNNVSGVKPFINNGACFGVAANQNGLWVAVGYDGSGANIWYSNDPTNTTTDSWLVSGNAPFGSSGWGNSVAFNDAPDEDGTTCLWVAVGRDATGSGRNILYSVDPTQGWSYNDNGSPSFGVSGEGWDVEYANGLWVAVGTDGTNAIVLYNTFSTPFCYSDWSEPYILCAVDVKATSITYTGEFWVVPATNGMVHYSIDPRTNIWKEIATANVLTGPVYGVANDGETTVVVGSGSNTIAASAVFNQPTYT